MNTMLARMWIAGMVLGLAYGLYTRGGVTAVLIIPLVGGMFGVIAAMLLDEVRGRFRKRRR